MRTADTRRAGRAWLALSLLACLVACHGKWAEDRRFYAAVEGLAAGTPEQEVLRRLGPPADRGQKFYLGQADGFEAVYRAAADSGSVRWLFWRRGVADDAVCAVGFGKDDRVTFKACGGT